jgi:soluble lytic murein transglycosylase-like protein
MDAASNIDFGASLLRDHINYFRGHLAAGIAAYNCGPNAVVEALANSKSPDYFTTDRNYSARVQGYADYLRRFFAD